MHRRTVLHLATLAASAGLFALDLSSVPPLVLDGYAVHWLWLALVAGACWVVQVYWHIYLLTRALRDREHLEQLCVDVGECIARGAAAAHWGLDVDGPLEIIDRCAAWDSSTIRVLERHKKGQWSRRFKNAGRINRDDVHETQRSTAAKVSVLEELYEFTSKCVDAARP